MRMLLAGLALALPLVVGCSGASSGSPMATSPAGKLSFSAVAVSNRVASTSTPSTPSPRQKLTPATSSGTFDFGNIPSTQTYFFELRNTGTADIDNVALSANNAAVVVTPSSISVVPVEGTTGIVPLVSVQVLHGVGLNGHGTSPTLPAGTFTFTLTASGVDTSNNTITATADVQLNVLVAQFEIWASDVDANGTTYGPTQAQIGVPLIIPSLGPLDRTSYPNMDDSPYNGWYETDYYPQLTGPSDQTRTRTFTIKNTGNCPLTVVNYWVENGTDRLPIETDLIAAGQNKDVVLSEDSGNSTGWANWSQQDYFTLNSNNVVFDSSMRAADLTGRYYIKFWYDEIAAP